MVIRFGSFALVLAACAPLPAETPEDALKKTMSEALGKGAAFRLEGPFLAGGKLEEKELERITATIARSRAALGKQFFDKEPDRLLAVYLLPNYDQYLAFCVKKYGDPPSSQYGFYMPGKKELVMNIGTGTGTLVHEVTHALMDFDFPDCPAWFNEGLASLYEQSSTAGGKIVGLVNWRLPLLQRAVGDGSVPSWKDLSAFTGPGFYGDGSKLRYATARYLCMYLQEQNLLETFFEKFRDRHKEDPTGYATLESLFDRPLAKVEAEWRDWIGALKFD